MSSSNASRGASFVVAEQAAQTRIANNLFARFQRIIAFAPLPGEWPIADTLMRPQRVVEVDVGRDQEVEMLLAEHDEMSQAFILDRPDPAFDKNVLIRR